MRKVQQRTLERIGMINKNNFGTDMKIIKVLLDNRVVIQLQDEHKYEKEIHFGNFKSGNVENPYDKTIFGIGYLGIGEYNIRINNFTLDIKYNIWNSMLDRCYGDNNRYPAYSECTVCNEWLCYQTFAEWYENNYYDVGEGRMHLDKDILVKDNKVYSPETCLIVPQRINMIFMEKINKWNLPSGISMSYNNKYITSYNGKHLGSLDTLEEAIKVHDTEKRKNIKNVAEEYKYRIPSYI